MKQLRRYGWVPAIGSTLAIAWLSVPAAAQVTPADGQTQVFQQNGQYDIQGGVLSSQGDNLFYGFDQFSLFSGESAVFHAPDAVQNVFGQILGGQAAYINGQLAIAGASANLYLVNPAGILFGPDAQLSLPAHFTATTASGVGFTDGWLTADSDLTQLNGAPQQFIFTDPAASLINLGNLTVQDGQSITLLGGTVVNRGSLTAPAGSVTVAAVEQGLIQITQSGQVLSLTGAAPIEDWQLAVAELPAWLTGSDIDHALNLTQDASGQTLITGSSLTLGPTPGTAIVTGTIDTAGTAEGQSGGAIQVLGQQVVLVDASLSADGSNDGGSIRIGGDLQGGGTLPTATVTLVNEGSRLASNAIQQGNGGDIIVWANELTNFVGTASAQGGIAGGNGGFIEISGKERLQFNGEIALAAPRGNLGTLLLDPLNITIRAGAGTGSNDGLLPTVLLTATPADFIIYEDTLEGLPDANIILQATNNITVESLGNLAFSENLTGQITFEADADGNGTGDFSMDPTDRINTGGRDLIITAANITAGNIITGETVAGNNPYDGGDITLTAQTGNITTGNLDARSEAGNNNGGLGGQVTVFAAQNITTGNIFASSIAGNNNASDAGNVSLTSASGNITTGSVNATSRAVDNNAQNGGNISIFAPNGEIVTQEIRSFSRALGNNNGGAAGNVTLSALENIRITYVDAEAENSGGIVDIATDQQFTATGTFNAINGGIVASISSTGRNGDGQVILRTENTPFELGGAPTGNGTSGGITSGRLPTPDVVAAPQTLTASQTVGNIQITLTNTAPSSIETTSSETTTETVTTLSTAAQTSASESSELMGNVIVDSNSTSAVTQLAAIENGLAAQFADQLGLSGNDIPLAASLEQMQRILKTAEDQLQIRPALVYLYFAEDQLEALVVTSQGQPSVHATGFSRDEVLQLGQNFRWAVTNPTSMPVDYLPPAQALYQALIEPIEAKLDKKHIDNLALVLDTGLRSLPLAALHDGEQFLIERYAIGVLPTFNLTNFDWANTLYQRRDNPAVLAMGIAEFTDQPTLPAVPTELSVITQKQHDRSYLNAASTLEQLQTSLETGEFGIVHLATHALFEPGAVDQAYVQLWDQTLRFDQLKSLDFQAANVSLLVLSACKTALGDEAAEFGFAGLAVSTGAQSALASLWAVSDDGALGFMAQFYQHLRSRPVRGEAVRQAQLDLLSGQVSLDQGRLYGPNGDIIATLPELDGSGRWDFSHPVYWSAFTLIGNPW